MDYEISTGDTWNFALVLADTTVNHTAAAATGQAEKAPTFDPTPSHQWASSFPFDDSGEYPFSIKVPARQLHSWGYWDGSKITAVPPPSPVSCNGAAECGEPTQVRLVPFGSTNIRISVFPWMTAPGPSPNTSRAE